MLGNQLQSGIEEARRRTDTASRALDDAILNDPDLSNKERLVLIHLISSVRQQNLMLEVIAINLDHLNSRIDLIMDHIKK